MKVHCSSYECDAPPHRAPHPACSGCSLHRTCGRRWRSTACSMHCAAWQFLALAFHSLWGLGEEASSEVEGLSGGCLVGYMPPSTLCAKQNACALSMQGTHTHAASERAKHPRLSLSLRPQLACNQP